MVSKIYLSSSVVSAAVRSMAARRIQDFWKGVDMYKGVGVLFANYISFFLNIPRNNLVLLRPNYFIFIGYLKTGTP